MHEVPTKAVSLIPRPKRNDWHIIQVSDLVLRDKGIQWLQMANTPGRFQWQKKIVYSCNYRKTKCIRNTLEKKQKRKKKTTKFSVTGNRISVGSPFYQTKMS